MRIEMLLSRLKEKRKDFLKFLPLISFIVPLLMLYLYQNIAFPNYPFEATWKGRAFYLFFIWFTILEMIISWEKLHLKAFKNIKSVRTIALLLAFLLPTIYVIISSFYGLNNLIYEWGKENCMEEYFAKMMPLSVEYLVLGGFFILIIFLQYGIDVFRTLMFSQFFLIIIGVIYTIDNLYPYGQFMPFQFLTPATTIVAQNTLNFMGYKTSVSYIMSPLYGWMPTMVVQDPNTGHSTPPIAIAWPCSGIESLLIYTIFISFFLRNFSFSRVQKIIYFVIGAIVTYFINIVRIVVLFLIALNSGIYSPEFRQFHDFYAQLISVTWIASYPLLIILIQSLLYKNKISEPIVSLI